MSCKRVVHWRFWHVMIGLLIVVGCTGEPLWREPIPPTAELIAQWLREPACPPPCWEQITPGLTTIDDAADMVAALPGVRLTASPNQEPQTSPGRIEWYLAQGGQGWVQSRQDSQIVESVTLDFSSGPATLRDIMAVYGEPDQVRFFDTRGLDCELLVSFADQGLVLYITSRNLGSFSSPRVRIADDSQVYRLTFIEPGLASFRANFPAYRAVGPAYLSEWRGYGEYP